MAMHWNARRPGIDNTRVPYIYGGADTLGQARRWVAPLREVSSNKKGKAGGEALPK